MNEVIDLARRLIGQPVLVEAANTRNGDVPATHADLRTAQRLLDRQPYVDLDTGMAAQLDWLSSRQHAAV
ncbi:hypothetical protein [Streptosporangium sp. NPDC051022]|uniref:hypothetical protein n=1 Tax=Streptosporangium sp. NPDC051022 TaxID=3155752 RepID=UPI00342D51FC